MPERKQDINIWEIELNGNEMKSKMLVLFITGVNQLTDTLSAMWDVLHNQNSSIGRMLIETHAHSHRMSI